MKRLKIKKIQPLTADVLADMMMAGIKLEIHLGDL